MKRSQPVGRIALGSLALTLWFVLFCGGLLIQTIEYRVLLAPDSFSPDITNQVKPYEGSKIFAFFWASLWFTPTNLAFLALLAGLLGGCGSNIVASSLSQEQSEQLHPHRMKYLEESPWSAMIRSFIVYLCVIAGLYFAIDDPFKNSTSAQYMRLSGTISVLAFLVGYDPTRIRAWIGLVPNPPSQKVTVTEGLHGGLKVEAKQGPSAASNNDDQTTDSSRITRSVDR